MTYIHLLLDDGSLTVNFFLLEIIHTVGPQIRNDVTEENEKQLKSCYINSLDLASRNNLKTIVSR